MAGEQLVPWIDSGDAEGNRNSMQNFEGDGTTTSWDFNFAGGYIDVADVKAYIYRGASGLTEAIDPVVLTGPNTIQVIPAVPVGDFLVVYRDTPKDMPLVNYSTGAVLDEANLDKSNNQAIFVAAEMSDRFDAINASSADAIARSFEALTIANAADDKADIAIADSAAAVSTANAANATAAAALDIAEDAVAASTGFQTDLQFYEVNDTTRRGAQWQLGTVALPGNKRWFVGADTGSDLAVERFNDAGTLVDVPVKVQRSTGNLIVSSKQIKGLADGSAAQDAATKAQVDLVSSTLTADYNAQKIDKDGTLDFAAHQKLFNSTPTDPLHAASKGYVDARDASYASDASELIMNPHGSIQTEGAITVTGPGTAYFCDQWFATGAGSSLQYQASVVSGGVSLYDPSNMFIKTTLAKAVLATGDHALIVQPGEGTYIRRLLYGTANARGSWLRWRASCTQAATISVSVSNGANNRSFVSTFSVTTTPTDFSLFIPGDTTGTWPVDGSKASSVVFCHASGTQFQTSTLNAWQAGQFFSANSQTNLLGTLNAQLNITDVSWKPSSILLPFQSVDFGLEVQRAQRYLTAINPAGALAYNQSPTVSLVTFWLPTSMRQGPSFVNSTTAGYSLENMVSGLSSVVSDRSTTNSVHLLYNGVSSPGVATSGRIAVGPTLLFSARM